MGCVGEDRVSHDCPAPDPVRVALGSPGSKGQPVTRGQIDPQCLQSCHVDLYVSHVDSVVLPDDTSGGVFNFMGVVENDLGRDVDLTSAFFAGSDSDRCDFVLRNPSTATLASGTAAGRVASDASDLVSSLVQLPWLDMASPSLDFEHDRGDATETCTGLLWVEDVCVRVSMTVEYSADATAPQRVTATRSQGEVWPCWLDRDGRLPD